MGEETGRVAAMVCEPGICAEEMKQNHYKMC